MIVVLREVITKDAAAGAKRFSNSLSIHQDSPTQRIENPQRIMTDAQFCGTGLGGTGKDGIRIRGGQSKVRSD